MKNHALHRAKLVAKIMKHTSAFKTKESSDPQSHNSNNPDSRLDGTTSGKEVYRKATPGQ